MKLTEHFTLEEFACRCGCGAEKDWIPECRDTALILEELRTEISKNSKEEFKIIIDCGVRCPQHNAAVGGAKKSKHLSTGYQGAADTRVPGLPVNTWAEYCKQKFNGCICYTGKNFVHVDRRNGVYHAIDNTPSYQTPEV